MSNKTFSDNACYAFMHVSIPLSFNNVKHNLGFESSAYADMTRVKYRFYSFNGLYWYCVIFPDGHMMNSLPFISLPSCVRYFRFFCDVMEFSLENSVVLSDFVAHFNKSNCGRGA